MAKLPLTRVAVTDDTGNTSLALVHNTCTAAIASGASCRFAASVPQQPEEAYTKSL
jgi:hypothetical protein